MYGDANGDGSVGVLDLLQIIDSWGCTGSCPGDVNGDFSVTVADLLIVISEWSD